VVHTAHGLWKTYFGHEPLFEQNAMDIFGVVLLDSDQIENTFEREDILYMHEHGHSAYTYVENACLRRPKGASGRGLLGLAHLLPRRSQYHSL
jgi:hypothetical protein